MYTPLYLKRITSKDLLYSTGNPAQCYAAAWMAGKSGGEWIRVYTWLSRFAVHLKLHNTVTQLYSHIKFLKKIFLSPVFWIRKLRLHDL